MRDRVALQPKSSNAESASDRRKKRDEILFGIQRRILGSPAAVPSGALAPGLEVRRVEELNRQAGNLASCSGGRNRKHVE
jgi:hypothetical protein